MRTSILAIIVVAGSAIAFPAAAHRHRPHRASKPEIRSALMQTKVSRLASPTSRCSVMQTKESRLRNSGESGYVADQDKPGTSAHPPGRPESEHTTGSSSQTGAPK